MQKKKTRTNIYVSKDNTEKQAYGKMIRNSEKKIDKTEEDKDNILNTDESSLDEEDEKKSNIKPKSSKLMVGDFIKSHILEGFILALLVGIVIWLFTLYSSNNREIGELKTKLEIYCNQLDDIKEKYQSGDEKFISLDKTITEINKDLEYLKEKINNIRNN